LATNILLSPDFYLVLMRRGNDEERYQLSSYLGSTRLPDCNNWNTREVGPQKIEITCRYKRTRFPRAEDHECLHIGESSCIIELFVTGNGQFKAVLPEYKRRLEKDVKEGVPGAVKALDELLHLKKLDGVVGREPPKSQTIIDGEFYLSPGEDTELIRLMQESLDETEVQHYDDGTIRVVTHVGGRYRVAKMEKPQARRKKCAKQTNNRRRED
jgi:hypothetical protein